MLSWDYGQDLDLWVYDKADRSNKVGWNVAGRSDSFAGGQITLDVDNWDGMEGPETTQFRNLASGTVEVWVNHYDDTFTQSLVESTPATVDIFCYRCLDDDNEVKVGFVRSVTQAAGDVPSGGRNWWKVGEFVAPGIDGHRVKWSTCSSHCFINAATANIAAGLRAEARPLKLPSSRVRNELRKLRRRPGLIKQLLDSTVRPSSSSKHKPSKPGKLRHRTILHKVNTFAKKMSSKPMKPVRPIELLKGPKLGVRRISQPVNILESQIHSSIQLQSLCSPNVELGFMRAHNMVTGSTQYPASHTAIYSCLSRRTYNGLLQAARAGPSMTSVSDASSASIPGSVDGQTQNTSLWRVDSGYYTAYLPVYVDADGGSVFFEMVEEMSTNQDRVVLSWDYGQDLDLWVYDKADRSNKVGWNVAGRSDSFAGGQITLDVDNWDGMEGPETTQFRNLASGTVEVWVNHYDDTFTQSLVASTPATVDIFCYRCLDDDNEVKVGFVRSVTQAAGDVPSGGRNWWKVGEFVAPGGSERVKWTTCVYNCYVDAATADLATSTGAPPVEVSMEAADMVTGSTISGVTYSVYSCLPRGLYGLFRQRVRDPRDLRVRCKLGEHPWHREMAHRSCLWRVSAATTLPTCPSSWTSLGPACFSKWWRR